MDGPPAIAEHPSLPLSTGVDTHAPKMEADQPPVRWIVARDVLGRVTTASVRHGSVYEGEFAAQVDERYTGHVSASSKEPAEAAALATTRYRIAWPETQVETEAHLTLRSTTSEYRVVIDVRVEELGTPPEQGGLGRIERRFERVIPRDLQ